MNEVGFWVEYDTQILGGWCGWNVVAVDIFWKAQLENIAMKLIAD